MALVFDKHLDAVPGRVDSVHPLIRRVLAPNPGAFTYLGTGTYIVGHGTVAVIDPGPADPTHIDSLVAALKDETVSHIVCTHTHPDHSPGSRMLRDRLGGTIVGCSPHPADSDPVTGAVTEAVTDPVARPQVAEESLDRSDGTESEHAEERSDTEHVPDWQMFDNDTIEGPEWSLHAVWTPGHISNHLCFAFPEAGVLFSGDHVMAWSTSVVSPPTGNLDDYLDSLQKVRARNETVYWPTHGPAVVDPETYVAALIEHRLNRTSQIIKHLSEGPLTIPQLVAAMYPGLDERLVKAAGRSVLAHLVSLRNADRIASSDPNDDANTLHELGAP
jgi:glyoxylase-like metal-dependent hydrolase (beta-lactamase superfamily II)